MGRDAPRPGKALVTLTSNQGFGLVDVLVALLLLAVTLLGTGTALVRTQAASQAAMLQTRAIDLMADLAEDLRPGADAATGKGMLTGWLTRVAGELPMGSAQAHPGAIHMQWLDPSTHLPMTLQLPAFLGWPPAST
jgi:Tfp pilus assembly protein PilV